MPGRPAPTWRTHVILLGITIDITGGYTTLLVAVVGLQVAAMFAFRDPSRSGDAGQHAK